MSAVKQIQCPACGANSTFKQTDGSYRCNYCQSTFEVKNDNQSAKKKNEFLEMLQNAQKAQSGNTNDLAKTIREEHLNAVKSARKIGRIIIAFVLIFAASILSVVFTRINKSMNNSDVDVFSEWQKPTINQYESFASSKGPVIWVLQKTTRNKLDSVKYPFKIIEPASGKILKEGFYIQPMTWQESFNDSKELSSEFSLWGGLVWNASENNGLRGFDPYTFEEKENEKSLIQKFKELKSGIAKAEIIRYKHSFKLTTNDGDEYVFYPERNFLRKQEEDNYSYRTDTITTTDLYVSRGKDHGLWLITQRFDKNNHDLTIYEGDAKEVEPRSRKKVKFDGILAAKQANDRKFFRAQPLARYNGNLVLVYTESMKKKSAVTMECLNQEGKSVWINKIPELQKLNESPFDDLNCDFNTDNKTVIIDTYEDARKSYCYDLKTGKLLWTYAVEQ